MLNASSRRIISVAVSICFLKVILWVIFVNSLKFGTFFLKIKKSLLNLIKEKKKKKRQLERSHVSSSMLQVRNA